MLVKDLIQEYLDLQVKLFSAVSGIANYEDIGFASEIALLIDSLQEDMREQRWKLGVLLTSEKFCKTWVVREQQ